MKKLISAILCLTMTLTMAVPAFAAQPTPALQSTTREGIIGDIFYEETTPSVTRSTEAVNTILSGTVNDDGTVSTYQYENDELIEYHTTVPGSGIVVSTYINEDGTTTTKETVVKENATANTEESSISTYAFANTSTEILSPTSVRNLGYMHYRNNFTNELFSIDCEVREKYHGYEYYTFNKGAAETLSFWTNSIIAVFTFQKSLANAMANAIFQRAISYGIVAYVVNKGYEALLTRTIPCYWYDQEIHGTPTSPSGRGTERYLPGVYAFVNFGSGLEVKTEGYTVRDWGNSSMGRWMMYNVFGIDEAPTSWTNLDN